MAALLVTLAASGAGVGAGAAESPSYAAQGHNISFHNTPHRHPTPINGTQPTSVAKVVLDLPEAADLFVNFTSGIAVDSGEGCPCSVRAMLKLDGDEPVVVKRINVGSPAVQTVNKYEHDRQSLDGSYVFSLPAGKHTVDLIYQQVDGTSRILEAYYPNLQALVFARK